MSEPEQPQEPQKNPQQPAPLAPGQHPAFPPPIPRPAGIVRPVTHTISVFTPSSTSPDAQQRSSLTKNSEGMGRPVDYHGRDYQVDDSRQIISKASTQGVEDDNLWSSDSLDLVDPPFDLQFLSDLNSVSVTRRSCVEAKATNVAGLGYRIKKVDPKADETDRDDISDMIKMQLEKWAAKNQLSFANLIYQVKYDEESNGNGYIEVSRNRKGEIDGLYHIPSQMIRVKKDRSGFVQVLNKTGKKIPFYNFGDKVELKEDGTIELLPDRSRDINELIHFKKYSHKSAYYGVPCDISAIPTVIGDEAARDYNNKFFKFSATPELALVFSVDAAAIPTIYGDQPVKVEIDPNTKRDIEDHFRRNLATQTFEPAIFHLPPGVKLEIEKLSEPSKDSGWTNFRKNNKAEIMEAHRTPGIIIGSPEANYATAAIAKAIYLEQVIAPEQDTYEQMLMALLWPELVMIGPKPVPAELDADGDLSIKAPVDPSPENGIGIDPNIWRLDFKEMSVADKSVDATVHNIYATLGVMTINEIRMQLGMKPLPDGDKMAEPKPGAEGNATGQNAQLMQAAAGNPEIQPPFVTSLPPGTAKIDPTGLGDGRGPNGTITPKDPRRPFQQGGFTPANANTVGRPFMKSDGEVEENVVVPKAYLDQLLRQLGQG